MIAARTLTSDECTIPVIRPQLPTVDKIVPYLRRIDEARYYTNHGALLRELERRFARHFSVAPTQVAMVANGTLALSAALLASGAKTGKRCLLPAWTYVASAAAVWAANLTPHFVDVSPDTWMLDPEAIKRRSDLDDVGAVMVVSLFGAPIDISAWDAFTVQTGIPVVIDGAASFDTAATVPQNRAGQTPIMISLHATKVFGIGEGSLVLCGDESLVQRLRQICNFGIWGINQAAVLGYNGKLSEYHAAVGLAMLDEWDERRSRLLALTQKYSVGLGELPKIRTSPSYGSGWISCYCHVSVDGNGSAISDRLNQMGIKTRRWPPVHAQRAYQSFPRDPLPVTDDLDESVFALPFYHDLTDEHLARVLSCLEVAVE